jgi:hypothetical protein
MRRVKIKVIATENIKDFEKTVNEFIENLNHILVSAKHKGYNNGRRRKIKDIQNRNCRNGRKRKGI